MGSPPGSVSGAVRRRRRWCARVVEVAHHHQVAMPLQARQQAAASQRVRNDAGWKPHHLRIPDEGLADGGARHRQDHAAFLAVDGDVPRSDEFRILQEGFGRGRLSAASANCVTPSSAANVNTQISGRTKGIIIASASVHDCNHARCRSRLPGGRQSAPSSVSDIVSATFPFLTRHCHLALSLPTPTMTLVVGLGTAGLENGHRVVVGRARHGLEAGLLIGLRNAADGAVGISGRAAAGHLADIALRGLR